MTAKATRKRAVPSAAELKRQAASSRRAADDNSIAIAQLTGLVKAALEKSDALEAEIRQLRQIPAATIAKHDPSERLINEVLRYDTPEENFPEMPEVILPDHLQQVGRAMARNNPASITRPMVDTANVDIGQLQERPMSSFGDAEDSLAPQRPVDDGVVLENGKIYSKDKYDIEMFMQEMVLVRMYDSTDETQVPMPESINDGRRQFYIRGKVQWVKRYSLEPMARSKKTTYTQRKERDINTGIEQYVNIPHTALMYPFEVLKDSEKGKRWLRNILAESM